MNSAPSRRHFLFGATAVVTAGLIPVTSALARKSASTAVLNPREVDDLLFMREEEKLARDVYLTLHELWGHQTFANIALSEQRHMDAVLGLLDTYGLPDPAAGKAVGQFENSELQQLHDALIETGRQSVLEALKVGGIIEETDARDLVEAIDTARFPDIDRVYQNLLNGSYNHLRAFASSIEAMTGEAYEAQVISQEEVDAILAS